MAPDQIYAMAKGITEGTGGPGWWVYLLLILGSVVAAFIGSYLGEKGKNLATKEDIEKITHQVEGVKRQHQEIIENLKADHQLRMLAVERRLQAHQEAFTLWRELFTAVHGPDVRRVADKCRIWWESNCVYLGPKSHHAFFEAFWAAAKHQSFLDSRAPASAVSENWNRITDAPNIILAEVALPPLKVSPEELGHKNKDGITESAPQ